jgi:hypothetical protein
MTRNHFLLILFVACLSSKHTLATNCPPTQIGCKACSIFGKCLLCAGPAFTLNGGVCLCSRGYANTKSTPWINYRTQLPDSSWYITADCKKCDPGFTSDGGSIYTTTVCYPSRTVVPVLPISNCQNGQYWDGGKCQSCPPGGIYDLKLRRCGK